MAAAVATAPSVLLAAPTWTGLGTTDNWSDSANWEPAAVPGVSDQVIFDNTAEGVAGLNNVDVNFTIQKLYYGTASASTFNTIIPTGVLLQVDGDVGGTNNINQSRDNADFNVGHDLPSYTGNRTVGLAISGAGTLQIGVSNAASTADAVISRRGPSGTGTMSVDLNMSGLTQFNAYVDEFAVGIGGGTGGAEANAVVRLAQNSQILANTFLIGDHTGSGGKNSEGAVLRFGQSTDLRANNIYIGKQKVGTTATFDAGLASPTLSITSRSGGAANLYIGFNDAGNTGTQPVSVLDLTNAGGTGTVTFNATLGSVVIGRHASGGGFGRGELKMNAGTVTANTLTLAHTGGSNPLNTHGRLTMDGGSFTIAGDVVEIGGQSIITVNAASFSGGQRINVDELRVGVAGGTALLGLQVVGLPADRRVGTLELGANVATTLTFAGGLRDINTTDATVAGTLAVATVSVPTPSVADADRTTWFAGTGTWDSDGGKWANGLPAGFTIANGQTTPILTTTGTLINNGLTLLTPDWNLAVTPGAAGLISLTRTGPAITSAAVKAFIESGAVARPTALTIANESGADATEIQMTGGSLTVDAALTLGSATAGGAINQVGGAMTFNGGIADGGAGTSSVRIDVGTMSVSGNVVLDAMPFVATNGRTGSFTAAGGAVNINTTGNLEVGYRGIDTTASTIGTFDLSAATSTDITATTFRVGRINTGGQTGQARGDVKLSAAGPNTLTANSVILGQSANASNTNVTSTMVFGGSTNTVSTDTLIIGGDKSLATVTIAPGGTLTVGGRTGSLTDLLIGENNLNTGTTSDGTLDLTGGVFNATLDDLIIGRHGQGAGGGKGTLIIPAGNLSATRILLASGNNGGTSSNLANIAGTLRFSGGTITTESIAKGPGTATFAWTGGTLAAGAVAFDLVQNGATANLSPGGPSAVGQTNISGGYNLANGRWAIGLDGVTGLADRVNVSGLLDLSGATDALDVSLLAGAAAGQTFVIASYGTLSGAFNSTDLSALPPGSTIDYAFSGNQIAIIAVPEPASLALIGVAVGGLLARRRRRGCRAQVSTSW